MDRSGNERLTDILATIDRTLTYRPRLDDPDPALAAMSYDAVLRNLVVIGEAVRALPDQVKTRDPDVPWASIAGVNGGFFDINGPTRFSGDPLGVSVVAGELVSEAVDGRSALVLDGCRARVTEIATDVSVSVGGRARSIDGLSRRARGD